MATRKADRSKSKPSPLKQSEVTQAEAEAAVRTLLLWAGENPAREGLRDTPSRVVRAYKDWFSGYLSDPSDYLRRTFEEVAGYDEMIVLRDIEFESHCEHHMAPIIGRALGCSGKSVKRRVENAEVRRTAPSTRERARPRGRECLAFRVD